MRHTVELVKEVQDGEHESLCYAINHEDGERVRENAWMFADSAGHSPLYFTDWECFEAGEWTCSLICEGDEE